MLIWETDQRPCFFDIANVMKCLHVQDLNNKAEFLLKSQWNIAWKVEEIGQVLKAIRLNLTKICWQPVKVLLSIILLKMLRLPFNSFEANVATPLYTDQFGKRHGLLLYTPNVHEYKNYMS